MIALIVILVLAGIACLLGGAWSWFMAFAAGMSDAPSQEDTPGLLLLFGLPALGVALLVIAVRVG